MPMGMTDEEPKQGILVESGAEQDIAQYEAAHDYMQNAVFMSRTWPVDPAKGIQSFVSWMLGEQDKLRAIYASCAGKARTFEDEALLWREYTQMTKLLQDDLAAYAPAHLAAPGFPSDVPEEPETGSEEPTTRERQYRLARERITQNEERGRPSFRAATPAPARVLQPEDAALADQRKREAAAGAAADLLAKEQRIRTTAQRLSEDGRHTAVGRDRTGPSLSR